MSDDHFFELGDDIGVLLLVFVEGHAQLVEVVGSAGEEHGCLLAIWLDKVNVSGSFLMPLSVKQCRRSGDISRGL